MPNHNDHDQNTDAQNPFGAGINKEQDQVKVLPPEERDNFKGITINTGDSNKRDQNERNYYEYNYRDPQKRVYIRRIKLNSLIGFLHLLAWGLLAIAAIFIFFPFFLYFAIPLFLIALINNLLRRR